MKNLHRGSVVVKVLHSTAEKLRSPQKGQLEKSGRQELPAPSPGHTEYKKKSYFILKLNSCTNQGFISSPATLPTPRGTEHDDIDDIFQICCCLLWPTAPEFGTS